MCDWICRTANRNNRKLDGLRIFQSVIAIAGRRVDDDVFDVPKVIVII
jgi:hypothetical protein